MGLDRRKLDLAATAVMDIAGGGDWPVALEALSDAAGAKGMAILPVFNRTPGPFPFSSGMLGQARAYVEEGWIENDRRDAGIPKLLASGIMTDLDASTPDMMARDPFYQEFLRGQSAGNFAGLRLDIAGEVFCAIFQQPYAAAHYGPDDLAALVEIAPRISMAASILKQIDRARINGLSDALEAMTTAAFLLDRTGRIIRTNQAASGVLGGGLAIANGHLVSSGPDNATLQKYISRVLHAFDLASQLSGRVLPIRRATGRPLLVRVQRLRTERALSYFASAWGLVTVTDPDRRPQAPAAVLADMFRLTARETRIALLLAENHGHVVASAEAAGVSYETLRTHVKNIHAKTGTRTMGELVALLTRIAGAGPA